MPFLIFWSKLSGVYERSLFIAWMSAMLIQSMKTKSMTLADAFITGLLQDIEMLYIKPELAPANPTL